MARNGVILYEEPSRSPSSARFDRLDLSTTSHVMEEQNPSAVKNSDRSMSTSGFPMLDHSGHQEVGGYADYDERSRPGFLRNDSVMLVLSIVLGVATGMLFSYLQVSEDVVELLKLPGSVFLKVLRCLIVPMIFSSLTSGITSISQVGKMSTIGLRTALCFLTLSAIAVCFSVCVSLSLLSLHPENPTSSLPQRQVFMSLECPNNAGYLTMHTDERVSCQVLPSNGSSRASRFEMCDLDGAIAKGPVAKLSIAQQLTGLLYSIAPNNIAESFQKNVLSSVITFSLAFGIAALSTAKEEASVLLAVLHQFNQLFFLIITKLVDWSPLAVFSLVASSLSQQKALGQSLGHLSVLLLSCGISVTTLVFVIYPTILWWTLGRRNPFEYMRQMVPCAMFAFGCASSLATLPVTMRCVQSTREVPHALAQFITTIGCTVHMNGTAMMFPNAFIFLVATSPKTITLTALEVILVTLISTLASVGVAPIPNAGLVMIYSVWSTVLPGQELPPSFMYVVAIYWLLDRMNTMCNVLGDTVVARIIANHVDETTS